MTKGDRIRELREMKKMTQEELAKKLNTTKQTVSKYEKGIVTNIPSDKIEGIALALETTPEYILGWEDIKKDNDLLAEIIVRLRTDEVFRDVVISMYKLDNAKLDGVKQLLTAFLK